VRSQNVTMENDTLSPKLHDLFTPLVLQTPML
jgi:hypothetical protein